MAFTQDFTHSHAQVCVVTIIIKKPHQQSMIKPSYHLKSKNVIAQACAPGSEQSFSVTYPSENDVSKPNLIPMVLCN